MELLFVPTNDSSRSVFFVDSVREFSASRIFSIAKMNGLFLQTAPGMVCRDRLHHISFIHRSAQLALSNSAMGEEEMREAPGAFSRLSTIRGHAGVINKSNILGRTKFEGITQKVVARSIALVPKLPGRSFWKRSNARRIVVGREFSLEKSLHLFYH